MFMFILAMMASMPQDTLPDAVQLGRTLSGLHADILDFEFISEGQTLHASQGGRHGNRSSKSFQAIYAYREDGASFLDLYEKPLNNNTGLLRTVMVLKNGVLEQTSKAPDMTRIASAAKRNTGGPGSLRVSGSPENFVYIWFWKKLIDSPDKVGYKPLEWTMLDGNLCLKLEIDHFPASKSAGVSRSLIWLDLARGGHVLREDYFQEGNLWYRVSNVVLRPFKVADNKTVWFPMSAEHETFVKGKAVGDTPVLKSKHSVVISSLMVDQKILDSRFTLKSVTRTNSNPEIERVMRDVASTQAQPKKLGSKSDPVSVQRDLEEKIKQAELQAKMLDASPAAERSWITTTIIQIVLGSAALATLMIVFFLRVKK